MKEWIKMINERIKKCIAEMLEQVEFIEDNVDLKVYGIDSLSKVQLVISLEEEFGIAFDDDDINQSHFQSVSSIGELLKKYGFA
ncbi:MAG: phosphopantetheine-binding protein [Waltera sp.]|jgi:acyl carrier protein